MLVTDLPEMRDFTGREYLRKVPDHISVRIGDWYGKTVIALWDTKKRNQCFDEVENWSEAQMKAGLNNLAHAPQSESGA